MESANGIRHLAIVHSLPPARLHSWNLVLVYLRKKSPPRAAQSESRSRSLSERHQAPRSQRDLIMDDLIVAFLAAQLAS